MRGGDEFGVAHVFATPKAKAVAAELVPGAAVGELFPEVGGTVRLMADGSPYFIHEVGPWRVVLCVQHGRAVESGRFVVVNVEKRRRK
jgi:hypothetical protein